MKVYHGSYTAIDKIDLNRCEVVVLNRKNNSPKQQAHDYDIIEGPVADDRITEQIDFYIEGIISKEEFLNDLIYLPSHQICFCTVQSLQALTLSKPIINRSIHNISSNILQALMTDYGINEMDATDMYYISNIYTNLADEITEFYKKDWTEIYNLLKQELNISDRIKNAG